MSTGFPLPATRSLHAFLILLVGVLFFLPSCSLKTTKRDQAVGAPMGKVTIRYTFTEGDIASPPSGFHVWKALNSTGPFERLNRSTIEADQRPSVGKSQVLWVDRSVPLGESAWYYLEVVDSNGRTRKATAVSRAVALLPANDSP